jgi:ribose-phosphate pyrophosphokinase
MNAGWVLCSFDEDLPAARDLAQRLGVPHQAVDCHHFPDAESRVRIDPCPEGAIVFRALDHPNQKLLELLLLASVLAEAGSARPILVAPYLPYMRQDVAFRRGEAVSQRVVGRLLAAAFQAVLSVEPHLHRTLRLADVFPGANALAIPAAPALAQELLSLPGPAPLLVGPDRESEPLVSAVARLAGAECLVLEKTRHGDRSVSIGPTQRERVQGRPIVLIDDVVSTGATLVEAAQRLRAAGAARIEALIVHALFDAAAAAALIAAGIGRVRSCDTLPHPTNAIGIGALIADAIRGHDLLGAPGGDPGRASP